MTQRFSSILVSLLLLMVALPALASGSATFVINDVSVAPERGELFDVTIELQTNGESVDTARVVLEFDPGMLRAQTVRLAGSLERSAPGNYRDNTNGIVSWGGFTLGEPVQSEADFVTITFLALQEGETTLTISEGSRVIAEGEEKIDTDRLDSRDLILAPSSEAEAGVALLVLESKTHPDQEAWQAVTTASFDWTVLQGETDLSALYYAFDQSSDTNPGTSIDLVTSTWTVGEIEDGVHYFHLKGVHEDGRETPVEHYRVNVDVTAPNPIELVAQTAQVVEGDPLWFTFATTDETSGVMQYQIAINESDYQVQESPLEVTDLGPGTYLFRVAALDRAGNVAYEGQSVRIYPEGTELDHPEGYENNTEIEAITTALLEEDLVKDDSQMRNRIIAIIIVLFVAIGLGYVINKKRH